MRNFQILIIYLFSITIYAQNINRINSDLKISDSLTYEIEVRIYQGGGMRNISSLFRMFKDESEKWTVEFYGHYPKKYKPSEFRIEKRTLKSEKEMEFIFQNFIRSFIMELPSENEIQWKLMTRGNIEKVKKKVEGKEIDEYELMYTKTGVFDGEGFNVQVKNGHDTNEFEYSNPDIYLKVYPEINELNYMCEILNIIRNDFKIWENN